MFRSVACFCTHRKASPFMRNATPVLINAPAAIIDLNAIIVNAVNASRMPIFLPSNHMSCTNSKEKRIEFVLSFRSGSNLCTGLVATKGNYALVVKSISLGLIPPSVAFSQVQASAGLAPQEQRDPAGVEFSVAARSQVHAPAGRARHEQRGPSTAFSVAAFPQVQWRADFSPQEHLAWVAQTHPSPLFPQQVLGVTILIDFGLLFVWKKLICGF